MLQHLEVVDPTLVSPHGLLAQIAWRRGDAAGYLTEAAMAARLRGDKIGERRIAADQAAWSTGGRPALLAAMISSQRRSYAEGSVGAYEVARGLAMAGDLPGALAMLETALRAHDPGLMGAAADAVFSPLHNDPRFAAVLAAVRAEP